MTTQTIDRTIAQLSPRAQAAYNVVVKGNYAIQDDTAADGTRWAEVQIWDAYHTLEWRMTARQFKLALRELGRANLFAHIRGVHRGYFARVRIG